MMAFAVPPNTRLAVARVLFARLSALLESLIDFRLAHDSASGIYFVDTLSAGLALADADAAGPSGDFLNEIHPSRSS